MTRLSGLDAAFLYLETDHTPMNMLGTVIVDASDPKSRFCFEEIRTLLEARLHRLAPLRRRLQCVPLGLGHPVWIEDPDFDLRKHVRRWTAPPPGSDRILARIVAELAARPLDRSRPLWELWVVDGLERGRAALVFKLHHAAADGIASAQMLMQLLDSTPEGETEAPRAGCEAVAAPTRFGLLRDALSEQARRPARLARVLAQTARSAVRVAGWALGPPAGAADAALPFQAPRTRFSGVVSARRAVAYGRAKLRDLQLVKSTFGVTLNDVVLAGCTGALRNYLEARGELPSGPLVATVPVCVRRGAEWGAYGNLLSALFVHLPVHIADPFERLVAVGASTQQAKQLQRRIGTSVLRDWAQLSSPRIFEGAARLYSRFGLANRHRPFHNLVISNVPGPSMPLYAAGARVVAAHPLGPLVDGAGINITVLTYVDSVDFGIIACEESVPDLGEIALGFGAAIGDLVKLALEEGREPFVSPAA